MYNKKREDNQQSSAIRGQASENPIFSDELKPKFHLARFAGFAKMYEDGSGYAVRFDEEKEIQIRPRKTR
jgi:hypothetical protein